MLPLFLGPPLPSFHSICDHRLSLCSAYPLSSLPLLSLWTRMSLSTEGPEIFQQIQQITAGLRNQVFPKIPEPVIQQLWGPLALNGVSLVAAFATMAYIHFFSDSKLQFFRMHNIRGMSMPIPTIEYASSSLFCSESTRAYRWPTGPFSLSVYCAIYSHSFHSSSLLSLCRTASAFGCEKLVIFFVQQQVHRHAGTDHLLFRLYRNGHSHHQRCLRWQR